MFQLKGSMKTRTFYEGMPEGDLPLGKDSQGAQTTGAAQHPKGILRAPLLNASGHLANVTASTRAVSRAECPPFGPGPVLGTGSGP